jgi:hypothetical protein
MENEEPQPKRVRRDPFRLEPSFVSIPVYPVLVFDAIGKDGTEVPRLHRRSADLLDLKGERHLLDSFTCSKCKDISSTTSRVPCSCEMMCDACKKKSYSVYAYNDESLLEFSFTKAGVFACVFCSAQYSPEVGYEKCPPLSIYSRRIGSLFGWVVGNCAATCHICQKSHESIQALHLHMPDCANERYRLCKSVTCLRPIDCETPHQCAYGRSAARDYGRVRPLPARCAFPLCEGWM